VLTFRKANPEDIGEVHKIYVDAAKHKHKYDDYVWKDGFSRKFVVRSIKSGNIICIIEDDKRIVCVFSLEWEDEVWAEYDELSSGYLHRLAVANDYHGKNIGKQAIEWSQNLVKNSRKKYLRLDCPTENKKLCKYYESLGFELVEIKQLPQFKTSTNLYQIKTT
jgi:ribosomal protein S18 acetylase RimI-like enzyme